MAIETTFLNSFWFRHFLLCHQLANKMMLHKGWHVDNFAQAILEAQNGRYGNEQMNVYFWSADAFLCELHSSDAKHVFEYLEDEEYINIATIAKLTAKQIKEYYCQFCIDKLKF